MLQRIKTILMTLTTVGVLVAPGVASASIVGNVCQGVNTPAASSGDVNLSGTDDSSGCTGDSANGSSLTGILRLIINVLSIIVGFVAVVMIIVAGFRYITSGGESGKVTGAKNAIVYAIIGLIIVALAQVIVHFVLTKANSVSS